MGQPGAPGARPSAGGEPARRAAAQRSRPARRAGAWWPRPCAADPDGCVGAGRTAADGSRRSRHTVCRDRADCPQRRRGECLRRGRGCAAAARGASARRRGPGSAEARAHVRRAGFRGDDRSCGQDDGPCSEGGGCCACGRPKPEVHSGTHLVQLGSFRTLEGAKRAWGILQKQNPSLRGRTLRIIEADVRGERYFRVAAEGFGANSAQAMCSTVRKSGQQCLAYADDRPQPGTGRGEKPLLARR
ncbi:SPOR domain-containing protein [Novosphingobium panipatense]|uniref:SPOR domain-containing protein n=1 Tax=Novosphingobium panipatense TaxID=428991 RepID=UPI00362252D1